MCVWDMVLSSELCIEIPGTVFFGHVMKHVFFFLVKASCARASGVNCGLFLWQALYYDLSRVAGLVVCTILQLKPAIAGWHLWEAWPALQWVAQSVKQGTCVCPITVSHHTLSSWQILHTCSLTGSYCSVTVCYSLPMLPWNMAHHTHMFHLCVHFSHWQ